MARRAGEDARRQYPVKTVLRAREHLEAGWKATQVAGKDGLLDREGLGSPCVETVLRWANPSRQERRADAHRIRQAQLTAAGSTFRLYSDSPEYQVAFMYRLRREGVSYQNIARVCRVVFGITVSADQVRLRMFPEQGRMRVPTFVEQLRAAP